MKYAPWILALILLACLAWLTPAYKSVTKERDELKTENEKIKSETHEKTVSVPVLVGNRLAYRTTTTRDISTTSAKTSLDQNRDYSKTVTKRGLFTMMAYMDLNAEIAGSVSYSVLGPFCIGASFSGGKPYAGVGLAF